MKIPPSFPTVLHASQQGGLSPNQIGVIPGTYTIIGAEGSGAILTRFYRWDLRDQKITNIIDLTQLSDWKRTHDFVLYLCPNAPHGVVAPNITVKPSDSLNYVNFLTEECSSGYGPAPQRMKIAWSEDGQYYTCGFEDLEIWDIQKKSRVIVTNKKCEHIQNIAIHSGSQLIVTRENGIKKILINSWQNELLGEIPILGTIKDLQIDPSGSKIAILSQGSLNIYQIEKTPSSSPQKISCTPLYQGQNPLKDTTNCAFSTDGKFLAVCWGVPSEKAELSIIDTRNWTIFQKRPLPRLVENLVWIPNTHNLVGLHSLHEQGEEGIFFEDFDQMSGSYLFRNHKDGIKNIEVHPTRQWIATTSGQTVKIWTPDLQCMYDWPGIQWRVDLIAWHPTNAILAQAGGKRTRDEANASKIFIWEILEEKGPKFLVPPQQLHQIELDEIKADIFKLWWNHDGTQLLACDVSGCIYRWAFPQLKLLDPIVSEGQDSQITAVAQSPTQDMFVLGDKKGRIRIWDSQTGTRDLVVDQHTESITCLEWKQDGSSFYAGSNDLLLVEWTPGGKMLNLFYYGDTPAEWIAVHPLGEYFIMRQPNSLYPYKIFDKHGSFIERFHHQVLFEGINEVLKYNNKKDTITKLVWTNRGKGLIYGTAVGNLLYYKV